MLPRDLHKKAIDQFHDRIEEIDKELEAIREEHGEESSEYPDDVRERAYLLARQYFLLVSKLWPKIDDMTEYYIKHTLSVLKDEDPSVWKEATVLDKTNSITRVLYENSTDDSECLRIKFEKVPDVVEKLNKLKW